MSHRGIRKFFVRGFVFALPIILILGYTEYKLRGVPNSYSTKRKHLERQLDSIEVLVLGSSQMADALNPALFRQHGFNLCNIAQPLYHDIQLARRYIPRMPRLRCVIFSLSYFSFGYNLEDTGESWRDYYYYHFWDIKANDVKWYDSRTVSYIALYQPKRVLRYAARGFTVNEVEGMQPNGWNRAEKTHYELINDSLGHERVRTHDVLMKQSRVDENFRSLAGLVGDLRNQGIFTIFVTPPVYTTYSKFMNPATVALNRRLIDSLCTMYGCPYVDLSTDQRFVITDFQDNDHLNEAGAEKVSRILNNETLSRFYASR